MKNRPSPNHTALYRIAEQQGGFFTAAQAAPAGFSRKLLWHHRRSKKFLRVAHGIYRLAQFPASPFEDLFVAWLKCGPRAAVSHESALALYGLSDVIPGEIHITAPPNASRRRPGIHQHTNRLAKTDVTWREGLRVTTVPRTIADVARSGLAAEHLCGAIQESLHRGLASREQFIAVARKKGGRAARLILECLKVEKEPS